MSTWVLPAALRELTRILSAGVPPETTDPTVLRRARSISIGSFAVMAVSAGFIPQYWRLGLPEMSGALAAVVTGCAANLYWMRRGASLELCGHLAAAHAWLILVFSNYLSGGFYDPNFGWFYAVCLAGAVFVDMRGGWIWVGIVVLTAVTFWSIAEFGTPLENRIALELRAGQALMNYVNAALTIGLLASSFIMAQRHAERTLVTANQALEREIRDRRVAEREAQAADRAKSEFLANMSHEIRTPITAILGYADLLLDPGSESEMSAECRDSIGIMRRNGAHLLQIINDILDLSKIEARRLDVECVRFSPFEALEDVLSLMKVRAAEKLVDLTLEYEGPVPASIESDPTRFRQILLNLVGNAVKFTARGSVRIVARLCPDSAPPRLRVEVIDTGVGLSEEQLRRLFRPFSQADGSTTRRFGGTGLGLAICAKLADLLGGRIEARSTPGEGSRFSVELPVGSLEGIPVLERKMRDDGEPQSPHGAQPARPLSGSVLLVDDSPDNRRLIRAILERAGASVETAENGLAAVTRALERRDGGAPFDVILMDMQMPVLDGYEATRRLRSQGYAFPILALTAHAMSSEREKCQAAGCDDYATKPIDRAVLVELLRRYIAESRQKHGSPTAIR